ncbi:MAG: hypothetical protein S4CHLAM45_05780 [Chlamydiales bacterium]|nr:hypothetical protein [Chlamydiales bacterium]MCH9619881.1 hypothetical protein [Chlamydiales bacterium]MCH9622692.1 hypothetical protein [Chlamydiales bacterium]
MRDFKYFVIGFAKAFWIVRGVMLTLLLILLICSVIIYPFEAMSYFETLYMCLITALTIGYGDLTPQSMIGKIFSIGIGFIGLVFVGLVVAIATAALRETTEKRLGRPLNVDKTQR